jgi:hypothetical protein
MKKLFASIRLFLVTILLGSTIFNAMGQTSATIDPRNYSFANPYMIPNLPSTSDFNLTIKTGKPTYVKIAGVQVYTFMTNSDGYTIIANDLKILIDKTGHWIIEHDYIATLLNVTYQADLQDQTIGSTTYGDYPDFIWVPQSNSAAVSAGKYMAYYRWRNMDESLISRSAVDSLKTLQIGSYISQQTDGTGLLTRDTISILEKPTLNNPTKTLNFPTTTTGITYKLLKVGSISGTDTTWTETQNFTGDGNANNITLTDGKYKLTTTLGNHTAVYPYGYFVVGVTTAIDKTKEESVNYRLADNKLLFDNEVYLKFYSLQGQLLQQGQGNSFKLCRQAGIFKATDKNGNVLTAKIIQK